MNRSTNRPFPRIPGFEIEDRIGFGGFATVYRARQPGLDRIVAIKVVHRTREADDETLKRFRRECQAIGSLTGTPSVMTVFDLGTTAEGDPYLVLEHLEGGSLQERLEADGRFTWLEVVDVAKGVAQALKAAHGVGILHRDIKPANVLTDRYGNVRLGDFGIAHLAGASDTVTGDTAMTVSYAAPEMLRGERATKASDLYSLGALMYTLLIGHPPFSRPDDDSVAAVILRITSEPLPTLDAHLAPPNLVNLIEALTSKDRSFRPDADTVIVRLETIGDDGRNSGATGRSIPPPSSPRLSLVPPASGSSTSPPRSRPSGPSPVRPAVPTDPRAKSPSGPARRTPSFSSATMRRAPGAGRATPPTLVPRSGVSGSLGLSGSLGHAVFDSGPGPRGIHGGLGYAVDVVFVIDITASMWPVLAQVKAGARSFHDHVVATMSTKGKHVSRLRLRIVAYRDYLDNPSDALFHTPFYQLPEEQPSFDRCVNALAADGGGDEPESGLEALALAMASPWELGLDRRRHVIVLCTDASAHPLESCAGRAIPGYPRGIPSTFDALTDNWGDPSSGPLEYAAKRLLLYAPDVYPWNLISRHWDSVLHFPSRAGEGLGELDFQEIIATIAGSV